jgi:transcriptional regulator with XRE-family HTH domain
VDRYKEEIDVAIGEEIAEARKRKGITQQDLSTMINYSRESVAKYETGSRNVPKDLYEGITNSIDDPEFYFSVWKETAGHVSIPFFDGDYIDKHPASMRYLVQQETTEALNQLNEICWAKPVQQQGKDERERIKYVLQEQLDAAGSMINLVAVMCKEYGFSMKDIFRSWNMSLKVRKYNK